MSEDDGRVAKSSQDVNFSTAWCKNGLMYKEHLFDVFKIIITLAFCGLFMGMLFKFQTDLMKTKFMFVM